MGLNKIKAIERGKPDALECKGFVFRCSVSSFLSKHNSIETRKSMRLLKTLSCKGCEQCSGLWEYLAEDIQNLADEDFIGNLSSGSMYKAEVRGDYEDTEIHFRRLT